MVLRAGERHDSTALRFARDGEWTEMTYAELTSTAAEIARGLIALGVRPGERVSILSATRPEWTLADLGSLCAGAVVAPIYHSDSPDECLYILDHADSRVVFCENQEQLAKVQRIRGGCPELEHIVMFEGSGRGVMSLDELRHAGQAVDAAEPDRIASQVRPEDIATIVYTSGTTGPPKGCLTTHANLMRTARMYEQQVDLGPGSVVFMFLPLAHSLARVTQLVVLDVGGTIAYWRGNPKELLDDLASTRPTHVPAVPRVFEKVYATAVGRVEEAGRIKRAMFRWALGTGRSARTLEHQGRQAGPLMRRQHALADRLVLSKVRGLFGPNLELALTGAAPIAQEVLEFFDACGVLILEGYGMTETTAAATLNTKSSFRFGTAGRPLPGTELSIAPDGEILMRGPNVFSRYFKDDAATREALSEGGWLHSGDLGSVDEDGFLRITGRKKDIIITSGGKNITPANIEAALREIRWVSEAVVFGDERPYVVALLTLDAEEAPALAARLGVTGDIPTMAKDERVQGELADEVERVNQRFARVEQVKRFAILDRDLTQQAGELTPTMKVKRQVSYAEFKDVFDSLYE
jgi:long-chain acyl-CoA synthetase